MKGRLSASLSSFGVLVLGLAGCDAGGGSGNGGSGGGHAGSGGVGGTAETGGSHPIGGAGGGGGGATTGTTGMGAGGAATGGGGTGGTVVGCAALPLCDDFEGAAPGGPPDAATWSVVSPNCAGTGTVTIDGAVAHSGGHSVRIDGKGGYCNHVFLAAGGVVPALGDVVYGRIFVRFSEALGQGHATFLAMKDANDGGKDLRMGGQNGVLMYNRESDDATLPSMSPAGTMASEAPTPATWTCIQFRIDGAQGTITTWVDGAEVAGLVVDGAPTPDIDQPWISQKPGWKPDLQDLRLGWEDYGGKDMTLWMDDVALAKDEIGCQ